MKVTAKEWLRANDPKWVEPAKKAARTRATPYDMDTLGELLSGSVMRKVGGVWRSMAPTALCGDSDSGTLMAEVVSVENQERVLVEKRMEADRASKGTTKRQGSNWRKTQARRRNRAARFGA